jgi:hypothetical protein
MPRTRQGNLRDFSGIRLGFGHRRRGEPRPATRQVTGTCASFTAQASSGSDIDARNLRCETGSVDVSSGADARIFASGRLDVDASSGGGVVAYGNPGIGNINLSSGGSLRRAD